MRRRMLLCRYRFWLLLLALVWISGFIVFSLLMRSNESGDASTTSGGNKLGALGVSGGRRAAKFLPGGNVTLDEAADRAPYIPKKTEMLTNKYCNNPLDATDGLPGRAAGVRRNSEEGYADATYQLVSVYLVLRHGDRSALRHVPQLERVSCGVDTSGTDMYAYLRRYMKLVRRQRYRSPGPFAKYKLLPAGNKCVPQQLTNIGVLQHLLNGRRLREVYVNRFRLIPRNASARHHVIVKSTKYPRTFQSALAFLYAFLSDGNGGGTFNVSALPIVASANTRFCDPGRWGGFPCACDRLDAYHRQIQADNYARLSKHDTLLGIVRGIQRVLGLKASEGTATGLAIPPLATFDILMSFVCHQAALPCDERGRECVLQHQLDKLTSFLNMNEKQRVFSAVFLRYSLTNMYPLLREIAEHVRAHMAPGGAPHTHPAPPRVVIYSGHDVTLSPLMISLGFHDDFIPPYASHVNIELYRHSPSGEHFLRVLYNGKDMTRRLRFCTSTTGERAPLFNDTLCPVTSFIKFVDTDIFQYLNVTSYQQACQL